MRRNRWDHCEPVWGTTVNPCGRHPGNTLPWGENTVIAQTEPTAHNSFGRNSDFNHSAQWGLEKGRTPSLVDASPTWCL